MENKNQKKSNQKKTAPILPTGSHLYSKLKYHANRLAFERIHLIHKCNQILENTMERTRRLGELEEEIFMLKGLLENESDPDRNKTEIRCDEKMYTLRNVKSRLEKLDDDKLLAEVNLFLCEAQLEAYQEIGIIPTNFESPLKDILRPE
jgi:hypothetical protein